MPLLNFSAISGNFPDIAVNLKNYFVHKNRLLFRLFILSLVFFLLAKIIPSREAKVLREEMIAASRIMADAMEVLRECRETQGLTIDPVTMLTSPGLSE